MPVHSLPPYVPRTDTALFHQLHTMFGLGTYDETSPWWQHTGAEVGKIKAARKKRGLSIAELYVAALYCRAFDIPVRSVTWLCGHIPKAWAWWEGTGKGPSDCENAYAEAIRIEMGRTHSQWLGRLLRANPDARGEVYSEWLASRTEPA